MQRLILFCLLPSLVLASSDPAQETKKSENKLSQNVYRSWQAHILECDKAVSDTPCARCMAGCILSGRVEQPEPKAANEPLSYIVGVAKSPVSMGLLYLQCGDLCRVQAPSLQGEQRKKMQRKAFRFYEQAYDLSEGADDTINIEAEARLLDCYINGEGTKPDYCIALRIIDGLRKKSKSAAALATMRLGQMLTLGQGMENYQITVGHDLLRKAAEQNENHYARQLARAFISAAATVGILKDKLSDEGLPYEDVLNDGIFSVEAKLLAEGAALFREIAEASTVKEINAGLLKMRQMFRYSMPPAVRVVLLALYYRSELEADLQVADLSKKAVDQADDTIKKAVTGAEISEALKNASAVQAAWSFTPISAEAQRKIAQELMAYGSIHIASKLADTVLDNI